MAFSHSFVVPSYNHAQFIGDTLHRCKHTLDVLIKGDAEFFDEFHVFGAINRCKYAIENYDGSPQIQRALAIMAESYRKLGMDDLAADTEKVLKENSSPDQLAQAEKKKSWWKIW